MNLNKYKLLAGDASFRKFYRSSQNSIIVYSKKNKYLNLEIYEAINNCLIRNGVNAPKLKKEFYNKNYIEIDDLGNETIFKILKKNRNKIKTIISKFKRKRIRTSLFINPSIQDIKTSYELGSDCVEIHTGKLSRLIKSKKNYFKEFDRIKKCSNIAKKIGLKVHAGHGLDYKTTQLLSRINEIEEFNIGHYLIGESVFFGLSKVIKNFKKVIK